MSIFGFLAIGTFIYMMFEDFKHQTIDLRACGLLYCFTVLSCLEISDLVSYHWNLLSGLMLAAFMYLIGWQAEKDKKQAEYLNESGAELQETCLGFLPAVGMAILVWYLGFKSLAVSNNFLSTVVLSDVILDEISFIALGMLLLIQYLLLRKAKRQGKKIIYGFGEGDVLVCGVLSAVFGTEFLVIFFIAVVLQLLGYGVLYIFENRKEKKSNGYRK